MFIAKERNKVPYHRLKSGNLWWNTNTKHRIEWSSPSPIQSKKSAISMLLFVVSQMLQWGKTCRCSWTWPQMLHSNHIVCHIGHKCWWTLHINKSISRGIPSRWNIAFCPWRILCSFGRWGEKREDDHQTKQSRGR